MANTYTVSIKFIEEFMTDYNTIKTFERQYKERLMKVQAMPEKTDSNITDKENAHLSLQMEYEDVSNLIFTIDRYDVVNFYDEVMLEFNTYAQHDTKNDVFLFEDSFTPMFVFAYIAKMYPKILDYLAEYKLSYNGTVLVDFMKLTA